MKKITLPLLLIILTLQACAQPAATPATKESAAFAKDLKDSTIQLLDVRTTGEYLGGHIAGSLHADWNDPAEFTKRTAHLDKNKPVYVYCLAGGRSAMAANKLATAGFTVVNLKGGINAWQQAGQPVTPSEKNIPAMTAADYQATLQSAEWVLIDFGADWCPPCVKIKPAIDSMLAKHSAVKKVLIDPVINKEVAATNKAVNLPTFILYRNGKEVFRREGIFEVAELEKVLQ
jgi:rhodanese-related sulfurtransferase